MTKPKSLLFGVSLFFASIIQQSNAREFLVDFGSSSTLSPAYNSSTVTPGWNNITKGTAGTGIANLNDTIGASSGIGISITDSFWQTTVGTANKDGTTSFSRYAATATSDSFFIGTLNGTTDNSAALHLSGLNQSAVYSVTLYASRMTSDTTSDRTTIYTINGISKSLQVRNNVSDTIVFSNLKAVNGSIDITIKMGPNSIFGYLGILDLVENFPPSVSITSPGTSTASTYNAPATIPLSVKASDMDGTITKVSYYHESTLIGTTTSAPFSYTWNNVPAGKYSITAVATDSGGASTTSTPVSITVNNPPQVNAGADLLVNLPSSTATLSGSATDTDGTISSYSWTQPSGPNTAVFSNANSASTGISGLIAGTYAFKLKAVDNSGASSTDTVNVVVNSIPDVNAGADLKITLPTNSAILSGSATDTDGTISKYQWTQSSGPSIATIQSPGAAQTSVSSLVQGTYVFNLKATDNRGAMGSDSVSVTVAATAVNTPPTANAGADKTITLPVGYNSMSTSLTGSGNDTDGSIASYTWTFVSGPNTPTFSSVSSAQTTVNNLIAGVYTFNLKVTDNVGASGNDSIIVTIVKPAIPVPVRVLSAREMPEKYGCGYTNKFTYVQDCNGYVQQSVSFPSSGTYRFDIQAYSYYTGGAFGKMELRIDGLPLTSVEVNQSNSFRYFTLTGNVASGNHKVAIALTNDEPGKVNRKLYLGMTYIYQGNSTSNFTFPPLAQPAAPKPGEYLTSDHFASGHLRGFNLATHQTLDEVDLSDMAATGANITRFLINLDRVPGTDTYQFTQGGIETADRYVAYAQKYGFYIVLVLNPQPGGSAQEFWDNPGLRSSILSLWKQMATRYKGNSSVAGFALMNEPTTYNFADYVNFAQQLIQGIRGIDPNRVIIVPYPQHNEWFTMARPLSFYNLVYEFHEYQKHDITHQGIDHYVRVTYPAPSTSPLGVFDESTLLEFIKQASYFGDTWHVPFYIGEFSCVRWAPKSPLGGYSSDQYIKSCIKMFEAKKWTWCVHGWREYAGWDMEISPEVFYQYPYVNAKPDVPGGVWTLSTDANRSDTDAMKMLKTYFLNNY